MKGTKKLHKLLSMLLCCVMLFGLMSVTAFADVTNIVYIDDAVFPVVGILNNVAGITCESHYGTVGYADGFDYYWSARSNSSEAWSKEYVDGGSSESVDGSVFREGYEYRLSLKLSPTATSDTYDENTSVYLSNADATAYTTDTSFNAADGSLTVHFYFNSAEPNGVFSFDISKIVEKGGSLDPAAQAFTFELVDDDGKTPADYGIVMDELKVSTSGVGTFNQTINGNASASSANGVFVHTFNLKEKNEGVAGWTYSDLTYVVEINYNPLTGYAFADVYYTGDAASSVAEFTNKYVAEPAPSEPVVVETPPQKTNPDTGVMAEESRGNSNMLLFVALLLAFGVAVTGTALYNKRKNYTK